MSLYKSFVMKAEGFSCPCLCWGVSIRSLTKRGDFPTAQEIKDVLSLVRTGCEWPAGRRACSPRAPGSLSHRGVNLSNAPCKLGKRRLLKGH